jgi:hypothetical protein
MTRRVRAISKRRISMKTFLFRNAPVCMLAVALHAQTSSSRYTVTDLGTLGGTFSVAFGINNAGRVGGAAALPSGNVHAYLTEVGASSTTSARSVGPRARQTGLTG